MAFVSLYMTYPSRADAETSARALLGLRLIACANIIPGVRSLYVWEGAVQEDDEVVMFAKTTTQHAQQATEVAKRLHPYQCPCIIALPFEQGNAGYLEWLRDTVA